MEYYGIKKCGIQTTSVHLKPCSTWGWRDRANKKKREKLADNNNSVVIVGVRGVGEEGIGGLLVTDET